MTDLNTLTKPALNDMLAKPFTASALKKITNADLVAMIEAQPPNLTAMEKRVLVAYLEAGIHATGAETLDDMLADNMTWGDVPEFAPRTDLTQKQMQGVISSLNHSVNGHNPVTKYSPWFIWGLRSEYFLVLGLWLRIPGFA